jgi:hypothetical protein
MHSHHKARLDTPHSPVEARPKTVYERLHQFRTERQNEIDQAPAKQRRVANIYGEVPCDLDRIAQANSSDQLLNILNDVVGLLRRCGSIEEMADALPVEQLRSINEVREALIGMVRLAGFSGPERSATAEGVVLLRIVLEAAERRFRELRI